MVQYIIVGQGIAGTIMSYLLYKNGHSFKVISSKIKPSSTEAAAGIMNPITGKYMALSWQYELLYPFALEIYTELCELLDISISFERDLIRPLKDQKAIQDWEYRSTQERYVPFVSKGNFEELPQSVNLRYPAYSFTNYAFQIPVAEIQSKWYNFLDHKGHCLNHVMDYNHIDAATNTLWTSLGPLHFGKLIFCEGAHVIHNPFFNYLPFDPVKGEVLICRIPDWKPKLMYKDSIFIVPWQSSDLYWVGSTYEWKTESWQPTPSKRSYLLEQLRDMYKGEFEVVDHIAGIRPAIKDRKPVIGAHPDHNDIIIFNGLGTKGTSLAPFTAKKLYDYIEREAPLPLEISIDRFSNLT